MRGLLRQKNQDAKRSILVGLLALTGIVLCGAFTFQLADGLINGYKFAFRAKDGSRGTGPEKYDHEEYRILTSLRNTLGHYNSFNIGALDYKTILNPTILELPHGAPHEYLVITRIEHVDKTIGEKKYRLGRQLAFFANMTYDKFDNPTLTAGEWSQVLLEDYEASVGPEHHCIKQPTMDKYIGPEDMKLFWTRRREPLLIFTHQVNDPILCEGMYLIDARAAIPELDRILNGLVDHMPAIRFEQPTLLRREAPKGEEDDAQYQREKNWAPVQPLFNDEDELLFMVQPGNLFEWKSAKEPVEQVDMTEESAVEAPYPPGTSWKDTWHSKHKTCIHDIWRTDKHIHQSTPMLVLTLCNRGECRPTPENTVMIGMVQRRVNKSDGYPYTWYDHRIAVYEAAWPYRMMSASRMLTYHGEVHGDYTWTGSMTYHVDSDQLPRDRSHGFLDDEIWLGFGIKDRNAGWLDVRASDLVQEHFMCKEATSEYKDIIQAKSLDRWVGVGAPP